MFNREGMCACVVKAFVSVRGKHARAWSFKHVATRMMDARAPSSAGELRFLPISAILVHRCDHIEEILVAGILSHCCATKGDDRWGVSQAWCACTAHKGPPLIEENKERAGAGSNMGICINVCACVVPHATYIEAWLAAPSR